MRFMSVVCDRILKAARPKGHCGSSAASKLAVSECKNDFGWIYQQINHQIVEIFKSFKFHLPIFLKVITDVAFAIQSASSLHLKARMMRSSKMLQYKYKYIVCSCNDDTG